MTHDGLLNEFEFLRSFVLTLRGKDVLEVGFGGGDLIPLFLKEEVNSYRGIDFSDTARSTVQSQIQNHRVKLDLYKAKDLSTDGAYDVITMFNVIENIPAFEMELVWEKVRIALRPGGLLVLSTPIRVNPNGLGDADSEVALHGIHCHKQTLGTIMRASVKHGFVIGGWNECCFGLCRHSDLQLFPPERRAVFIRIHQEILAALGKPFNVDHAFAPEDIRSLVPGVGRLLIGCVVENTLKYRAQALRLVESIRWFGGSISEANIMVCMVDEADEGFADELRKLGGFIRIVPRFSYLHPYPNKLRFFEIPELFAYDTIMLLDGDTVVVQDPSPYIDGRTFQARIEDGANVPHAIFERLFSIYNMMMPGKDYVSAVTGEEMIWYCNSGVLIFPVDLVHMFARTWERYTSDLVTRRDLLGNAYFFCDQIALTLAFHEAPIPFSELPLAMNFPLHKPEPKRPEKFHNCDPAVIHYHYHADEAGFLGDSPFPKTQVRIDNFNAQLRQNLNAAGILAKQSQKLAEEVRRRDEIIDSEKALRRQLEENLRQHEVALSSCHAEIARLRAIENSLSWRVIHSILNLYQNDRIPGLSARAKLALFLQKRVTRKIAFKESAAAIERPVFVLGSMRSGTTLLAEMLGRHRAITYCPFELRAIWSAAGVPMASPKTRDAICPALSARDVKPEQISYLARAFSEIYVDRRETSGKDSDARFLTKNPHLCNKLPFVEQIFPRAQYIWIYRNMLDVVASLKRLLLAEHKRHKVWHVWAERHSAEMRCWNCLFGENLPQSASPVRTFPGGDIRFLAEYWLETNLAVSRFLKKVSAKKRLMVAEEDLISNPAEVLTRCANFLGISADHSILDGFLIQNNRNAAWRQLLTGEELASLISLVNTWKSCDIDDLPRDLKQEAYRELLEKAR
jgi:SAM-dependent methyltransferase